MEQNLRMTNVTESCDVFTYSKCARDVKSSADFSNMSYIQISKKNNGLFYRYQLDQSICLLGCHVYLTCIFIKASGALGCCPL